MFVVKKEKNEIGLCDLGDSNKMNWKQNFGSAQEPERTHADLLWAKRGVRKFLKSQNFGIIFRNKLSVGTCLQ